MILRRGMRRCGVGVGKVCSKGNREDFSEEVPFKLSPE